MVAIYLWPVYHPFLAGRRANTTAGAPPYWVQLNHHFFFVIYSFVVMGLITVFEWDLFFPDLLDIQVMGSLPVPQRRVFMARRSHRLCSSPDSCSTPTSLLRCSCRWPRIRPA